MRWSPAEQVVDVADGAESSYRHLLVDRQPAQLGHGAAGESVQGGRPEQRSRRVAQLLEVGPEGEAIDEFWPVDAAVQEDDIAPLILPGLPADGDAGDGFLHLLLAAEHHVDRFGEQWYQRRLQVVLQNVGIGRFCLEQDVPGVEMGSYVGVPQLLEAGPQR